MAVKDDEIGEATVTSKGQVTVPGSVRKLLKIEPGDRLKFVRSPSGRITIEARKHRSILSIARENILRPSPGKVNLDDTIDHSITEAMQDRVHRAGGRKKK